MNKKEAGIWCCQIVAAIILLYASSEKLISNPEAVSTFTKLGMEPTGRYLIGMIELFSSLTLLTRSYCAIGAFLGLGTMCGAVIAHITFLGLFVNDDKGLHVILLSLVFISCCNVLWQRRKSLPFIGSTL